MEAVINPELTIDRSVELEVPLNSAAIRATGGAQADEPDDWKRRARRLQDEIYVAYLVFRHPQAPWYSKLLAALALGYVMSPVQLIPSFIPFIGLIDDLLVLVGAIKLMHKLTPRSAMAQCRGKAESVSLQVVSALRGLAIVVAGVLLAMTSGFLAWGCWVLCHLTRR